MDENGKFPDYSRIWDNANQARDIHMALLFALAATAFTEGWEALRPRIASSKRHLPSSKRDQPSGKQDAPSGRKSEEDTAKQKADAFSKATAFW